LRVLQSKRTFRCSSSSRWSSTKK